MHSKVFFKSHIFLFSFFFVTCGDFAAGFVGTIGFPCVTLGVGFAGSSDSSDESSSELVSALQIKFHTDVHSS